MSDTAADSDLKRSATETIQALAKFCGLAIANRNILAARLAARDVNNAIDMFHGVIEKIAMLEKD